MKYVIAILSLLVSFGVAADTRLNQDINTCHGPKHPNNTDDEFKHSCSIVLDEDAGQNAVAGFGVLEMKNIPLLTRVDQDGVGDGTNRPGNYTVTSDNNDETCTLRNDDGTETTTDDWAIVFESVCTGAGPTFCDFTYRIFCGYDTAEILDAYPNTN